MERSQEKIRTGGYGVGNKKRRDMSPGERVQQLQRKLYLKAKAESGYKFYILYDKVFLDYVLKESYSRLNKGAVPGIDGMTFKQISEGGIEKFLLELKEELRTRTYRPLPVKRVEIKKRNGGMRPLGIPTIRDRVVQMACKIVIEPIFEADFKECSHGFRPKQSAHGAMSQIKANLKSGKTEVYDADLSKYFDTIPHDRLMKTLELRIADRRVLALIKLWLKTPYKEGGKLHGGKRSKVGTPQGGVISPLLSNIYLHLLDRIVIKATSLYSRHGIRIIRYADDFVLMGAHIGEEIIQELEEVLRRMGLKINKEKTRMVEAKAEPFKFLGFTIRYDRSVIQRGTRFWQIKPSEESCKRLRQNLADKLKKIGHYGAAQVAYELNPILCGWLNYYDIPGVSYTRMTRKKLRSYLMQRLYRYYNRKSQRKTRLYGSKAFEILISKGMIDPLTYRVPKTGPKVFRRNLQESRMRENRTYGLMRG